ncbi:Hsp20/alpha crystallin family protein [candidate division KSB1 bacterium]|nr:Hsp20/alpha crystallin family protein [candidate division KSB1 bacterium]RQW06110.1 MAG: Hsp20/alpha crystallin family protein [candidate division KSB1 bacterium]
MYYSPARTLRKLYDMQREENHPLKSFYQDDEEIECRGTWIPNIDVKETSEALVLYAECPGLKKDDIKITVRDKVLSISGDKPQAELKKDETFHRVERVYGNFCRQFTLPAQIDTGKISAEFINGVLKLRLPKQERAKAQDIEIKSE